MWQCHINKDTPLPLIPPPLISCPSLLSPSSYILCHGQLPFMLFSKKINRKTECRIGDGSTWDQYRLLFLYACALGAYLCAHTCFCVCTCHHKSYLCAPHPPTNKNCCLSNNSFLLCQTLNKNMTDWWRQPVSGWTHLCHITVWCLVVCAFVF